MRVSRPAHNLLTAVARGTCRRTQPRAIVGQVDGDPKKRPRPAATLNPRRFGGDREGPAGQIPAAIVFSSSISAARLSQSRPIVSTANLRPQARWIDLARVQHFCEVGV